MTYELDFVASTSFTIYWWLSGNSRTSASIRYCDALQDTLLFIQTQSVLFRIIVLIRTIVL